MTTRSILLTGFAFVCHGSFVRVQQEAVFRVFGFIWEPYNPCRTLMNTNFFAIPLAASVRSIHPRKSVASFGKTQKESVKFDSHILKFSFKRSYSSFSYIRCGYGRYENVSE